MRTRALGLGDGEGPRDTVGHRWGCDEPSGMDLGSSHMEVPAVFERGWGSPLEKLGDVGPSLAVFLDLPEEQ
jgi:hypothetical protein